MGVGQWMAYPFATGLREVFLARGTGCARAPRTSAERRASLGLGESRRLVPGNARRSAALVSQASLPASSGGVSPPGPVTRDDTRGTRGRAACPPAADLRTAPATNSTPATASVCTISAKPPSSPHNNKVPPSGDKAASSGR
ncbi:hypothetical protein LBMAG56_09900 [Verrucomicrobiota bacterium]|nr:hypothetical protein LBMAG56_09900 [Verrucomicrobiota bacterium]